MNEDGFLKSVYVGKTEDVKERQSRNGLTKSMEIGRRELAS